LPRYMTYLSINAQSYFSQFHLASIQITRYIKKM
jgi:hypothetical protein